MMEPRNTDVAPPTTKPSYHHGNLRHALLDAAYEVVRVEGPDALSLRALAARLGVTPRAVYRHFDSKAALFHALGPRVLAEMGALIDDRTEALPTDQTAAAAAATTLQAIAAGYVEYAVDNPGAFEVGFFYRYRLDAHRPPPAGGSGDVFQRLAAAIAQLDALALLPAPPRIVGESLWATMHGYATLAALGPLRERPRARAIEDIQACVRAVIDPWLRPPDLRQ